MTHPLEGKVALVTGASRGIGRAIAHRLGADGALVCVHYASSRAAADEVVSSIAAGGGKAFAVQADLSANGGVKTLYAALDAELQARTGRAEIDILVNNAGIAPVGRLGDTTQDVFDQIFAVNVRSLFFSTQEAAKRLRDGGRVINISSSVARSPIVESTVYSASKAPVDNFTKTFAVELGPRRITVNSVAPGAIETDMTTFLKDAAVAEAIKAKQALKRIGQAEDIADVVAFLASDRSRWVTGQVIEASGGSALTF